jgi:alkane 1-monooxygenase
VKVVPRYQSLRSFPDLPTLPTGYFGMFLVALIPPLWYAVMDRRLLALPHVQGDFTRINVEACRREMLEARYGRFLPAARMRTGRAESGRPV